MVALDSASSYLDGSLTRPMEPDTDAAGAFSMARV